MADVEDYKAFYGHKLKLLPWQHKDYPHIKTIGDVLSKTPYELHIGSPSFREGRGPSHTSMVIEAAVKQLGKKDVIFSEGRITVATKFIQEHITNPDSQCRIVEILAALDNLPHLRGGLKTYDTFRIALQTEVDRLTADRIAKEPESAKPARAASIVTGVDAQERVVFLRSQIAAIAELSPHRVKAALKRLLDEADRSKDSSPDLK